MGLMVYSLENIPQTTNRDYFIYLLDYGWDEPISNVLKDNFNEMAKKSATNRAVIIKGTEGVHFNNEVFSWHHINGINGDDVLPALLITNQHPSYFRDHWCDFKENTALYRENNEKNMKLILIPFREFCNTSTEVIELIQKIFENIESQKDINDFSILSEIKKNTSKKNNLLDAVILQPNISGIGVDLKTLIKEFLPK
ncbi:MAG: hypothetical protein A2104_10170 [Candidatus Melainabacteria bacterium GWF2_32_7]|nr:MAG: hypothetical protein A2104_10170 [Candidatus Melainabacteria bacterium GWF2_32_7]